MPKNLSTSGSILRRALLAAAWLPGVLLIPAFAQAAPAVDPPGHAGHAGQTAQDTRNPPPTRKDWDKIADLPDWSGDWTPDVEDEMTKEKTDTPPWTPQAKKVADAQWAELEAGRPKLVIAYCLPEGMPSWMLISHNSMEILFSPGRVTMLGESDGDRIRRIYTDGRKHPEDPDLTIHGHSIGHWEGQTLVVDTVGIIPQSPIAISEAVGIPNNGDMHIVERLRLGGPDQLIDELTITAPKVLTKPWTTTRIFFRQRERKYEIIEGQCVQGNLVETIDKDGFAGFKPLPVAEDGSVVPQ